MKKEEKNSNLANELIINCLVVTSGFEPEMQVPKT